MMTTSRLLYQYLKSFSESSFVCTMDSEEHSGSAERERRERKMESKGKVGE